jgi:hypothetical protein
LSRAQKLHVRLGGSGAVADGLPPKPSGMHWETYIRLAHRFEREERVTNIATLRFLGVNPR